MVGATKLDVVEIIKNHSSFIKEMSLFISLLFCFRRSILIFSHSVSCSHAEKRMFLEPTVIKSSCYLLTEGRTELRTSLSSTTGPINGPIPFQITRYDLYLHSLLSILYFWCAVVLWKCLFLIISPFLQRNRSFPV